MRVYLYDLNGKIILLQWRFRIERLRVYLHDEKGSFIPNPSGMFGIKVTYPMIFHDMDQSRNDILFSARRFECRYYSNEFQF